MDLMPLSAVIFYSIPEEIILFSFGMTIVGEYINLKRILIASVIAAFASMLFRACVPFGLHSLVGILVLFILFWKLLMLNPWKALIASMFSVIALILFESITLPIIYKIQQITLLELWKDDFKRIVLGYPNLITYTLITWFLYSKKIYLIKGPRVSNDTQDNNRHLITVIVLSHGLLLSIINQQLDFLGRYLLSIKIIYVVFFICTIYFLKRLYSNEKLTLNPRIK